MEKQIERIIIINKEGTVYDKEPQETKTIHIESLELALNGNITMNNQNNSYHKNNLNIYLPKELSTEQIDLINNINQIINNYEHIAIHHNIQKKEEVYYSIVMSTHIKNFDISKSFIHTRTKKK